MKSETNTTRSLDIDGMSGDECVKKVTGALKGVEGVSTQNVKVGGATIGADQTGCTAACAAIGVAGYKARESNGPAANGNAKPGASIKHADHYSGGQDSRAGQPRTDANRGGQQGDAQQGSDREGKGGQAQRTGQGQQSGQRSEGQAGTRGENQADRTDSANANRDEKKTGRSNEHSAGKTGGQRN